MVDIRLEVPAESMTRLILTSNTLKGEVHEKTIDDQTLLLNLALY